MTLLAWLLLLPGALCATFPFCPEQFEVIPTGTEELLCRSKGQPDVTVEWIRDGLSYHEIWKLAGVRYGTYTLWTSDQREIVVGAYQRGLKVGTWYSFDDKGRVKTLDTYVEGSPDGAHLAFDEEGRVQSVALYRRGRLEWTRLKDGQIGDLELRFDSTGELAGAWFEPRKGHDRTDCLSSAGDPSGNSDSCPALVRSLIRDLRQEAKH